MNNERSSQPLSQSKVTLTIVIVWAVLASIAAAVFASLALYLFVRGNTPAIPVSVTFREAALDNSLVAQIRNTSDRPIKLLVKVHSSTTNETKQGEVVVGGNQVAEVGWAEGWRFVSGETLRLHHADYRDLEFTVP